MTTKEFLEGLLEGEIRCLHEKFEIKDELRGEKVDYAAKPFRPI